MNRQNATINVYPRIYARAIYNPVVHTRPMWHGEVEYVVHVRTRNIKGAYIVVADDSRLLRTSTSRVYTTAQAAIRAARKLPILRMYAANEPLERKKAR